MPAVRSRVPLVAVALVLGCGVGRADAAARPVALIDSDIAADTTLDAATVWVVTAEVHVLAGVTLTVADRTTILVCNGPVPAPLLGRCALIFDPGSQLSADTFTVAAGDVAGRPLACHDNGGIWFCGSSRAAEKDGITIPGGGPPSCFRARHVVVRWMGREEPADGSVEDDAGLDDIDGISVLGVGAAEWQVTAVTSAYSGDDGFDVENSAIRLERLSVTSPAEDGMNVTSATVSVSRALRLCVGVTRVRDRDLFDLETDEGPATIVAERCCELDLDGIFGDELHLDSRDLRCRTGDVRCRFSGCSCSGPTTIWSVDED